MCKDLASLSVETATEYFCGVFLDDVLKDEYNEYLPQLDQLNAKELLLSESKLQTISPATSCRWLAYLGFKYGAHQRVYYTDEHERPDNKLARKQYSDDLERDEMRKYKWVVLTSQQKQELESLEKDPLEPNVYSRTYENQSLFEYNISRHPRLVEFVSASNRNLHGGDLSRVRLLSSLRPLLEVGQDEAVFQQNAMSAMEWSGPKGESTPRPKSDGDAIMVSAFIGPSLGFGRNTEASNDALKRINHIRQRVRPTYQDEFASEEVLGTSTKKLFESEDNVQRTLCVSFEHGRNRDGYWNNAHMIVQTEDAVDIIQGLFPNHDLDIHFDQSSGHTKKRHFGLNAEVMIKSFGGSTPTMRDTPITAGCLGPYNHPTKLKVGDVQSMSFQDSDIGPWELSSQERINQRDDRLTGEKTTEIKRKKQLLRELGKTDRETKIEQ